MHFQSPQSQDPNGNRVFSAAIAKLLATTAKVWLAVAQPLPQPSAKLTLRLQSSNANKSFMITTS